MTTQTPAPLVKAAQLQMRDLEAMHACILQIERDLHTLPVPHDFAQRQTLIRACLQLEALRGSLCDVGTGHALGNP